MKWVGWVTRCECVENAYHFVKNLEVHCIGWTEGWIIEQRLGPDSCKLQLVTAYNIFKSSWNMNSNLEFSGRSRILFLRLVLEYSKIMYFCSTDYVFLNGNVNVDKALGFHLNKIIDNLYRHVLIFISNFISGRSDDLLKLA